MNLKKIKAQILGKSALDKPKVFVVGLQKSGTTLLGKLLQESGYADNLTETTEAHEFWGHIPMFTPTEAPAGVIYQKYSGQKGHQIDASDVDDATREILNNRLRSYKILAPVALNKNPFNSVRVPWIRALFPSACIVSISRNPVANVFSLYKKYLDKKDTKHPPENGWWGVKPLGWQDMLSDDKIVQISRQYKAVQEKLESENDLIDVYCTYHDLCANPEFYVKTIIEKALGSSIELTNSIPSITCLDHEYLKGASLRSKNKTLTDSKGFDVPKDEEIELQPFTQDQIKVIQEICGE